MSQNNSIDQETSLPGKPTKGFDVLYFILRRTLLIAVLVFVVFMCFLPVGLLLSKTYYKSEGQLLIARVISSVGGELDPLSISRYFDDYANTQARRLESYSFIESALLSLLKADWPLFLSSDQSIEHNITILEKNLKVEYIPGTQLLEVSIETEETLGIAKLDSVVKLILPIR